MTYVQIGPDLKEPCHLPVFTHLLLQETNLPGIPNPLLCVDQPEGNTVKLSFRVVLDPGYLGTNLPVIFPLSNPLLSHLYKFLSLSLVNEPHIFCISSLSLLFSVLCSGVNDCAIMMVNLSKHEKEFK